MKGTKGDMRFRWSTRRRLVAIIVSVFVALTVIVSVATFVIVDRQIDTVTVGRFAPEYAADEQYQQHDSAGPSSGGAYVLTGNGAHTGGFAVTASRGNDTARNLLLLTSVVPILIFGTLSAIATWSICTHSQRRIDTVAQQIRASDSNLSRHPIQIPEENDAASVIAGAYNDAIGDVNAAIAREKRFIADASHELKNPLTATSTALEIPVHNGLLDDKALPFVEKALASNRSCIALVGRLLDLAKVQQLERGELSNIAVSAVVEEVITTLFDGGIPRGLTLHKRLDDVRMQADPLLFAQLVKNLLLNAVQHNVAGGMIWVSAGEAPESDNQSGARMMTLVIENTGVDLHGVDLDDLFTPFNRGRNSRIVERGSSERPAGTLENHGLGLSIAKEIVLLHKGTIRLQARDGGGLRVVVNIPASS
ncbi:HAMP domain-containing histidine kinase [Bifidobacterium sp. 64T4]|uniref:sensor histidine kinase n=1 Tax=Bifidobacterium pongonis TaxID=2834432 RepID=UPI001C57E8E7|nr:HAMP domain-containing sensor histidine kinase [Bifidobacterium pongonis]MBW3095263.1 HAMP domain-containing histidine kinase [Bifidobacterium pongonis]